MISLQKKNYLKISIKETVQRKSEENSKFWSFLTDRIIFFDCAQEADRITIYRQTWFFHLTFSKFLTLIYIWNE